MMFMETLSVKQIPMEIQRQVNMISSTDLLRKRMNQGMLHNINMMQWTMKQKRLMLKETAKEKFMISTVFWFRMLINLETLQLINTMTRVNKPKRLMPIKIQQNLNMTSLGM